MNDHYTDNRELTEFSMERLMEMQKGVAQAFATPQKDRKGSLQIVITDTMGVVDGTMITDKPTEPLAHYNDKPLVEMNFMLEGHIVQTHEGLLQNHHYTKGYHNILFNPYSAERNNLLNRGTHHIFSMHVLPEHMARLFAGYLPELQPFAEKIDKGESFVIHTPANGLDNRFKHFFDTFWQSPSLPQLGKLYFESKMLELLSWQCAALLGPACRQTNISKADLEKVYYAKEIITGHISDPPSLTELSRLCGLNEFKLKKYCREVFHTSVFGLLYEERLQRAKRMLYEGDKNISAIAYELGYSHPQHFQRAFKKRFGVTPKGLLK